MQPSGSDHHFRRWIDPSIFGLFAALVLFVAVVSFLSVGWGEGYFSRNLCLGEGCLEEFARIFSFPVGLVVNSVKLVVAYSASAGILVAVNTYVETKRIATSQVHLASRAAFENYVKSRISLLSHLELKCVSIEEWYAAIYSSSHRGDLSIDNRYVQLVQEIFDFVARTDQMIVKVGKRFRHDRYNGPVMDMLLKLGISIRGTSRLDFFSLERESYKLINEVNRVFCQDCNLPDLKPSEAHRIP